MTHTQKKLESSVKTLEQARKAHEAHQAHISKLEEELRQAEEQKATWEASIHYRIGIILTFTLEEILN